MPALVESLPVPAESMPVGLVVHAGASGMACPRLWCRCPWVRWCMPAPRVGLAGRCGVDARGSGRARRRV